MPRLLCGLQITAQRRSHTHTQPINHLAVWLRLPSDQKWDVMMILVLRVKKTESHYSCPLTVDMVDVHVLHQAQVFFFSLSCFPVCSSRWFQTCLPVLTPRLLPSTPVYCVLACLLPCSSAGPSLWDWTNVFLTCCSNKCTKPSVSHSFHYMFTQVIHTHFSTK